ncbi:hypothetical protein [Sorangium sp. So ce1335]|uniref:hypothetical protein n=1 Tax=Sorangium sp. So ce1335 TaxID=3133335 RepID=UPI003F5FEE8C
MPSAARIALLVTLALAFPARASAASPPDDPESDARCEFSASSLLAFGLMPMAGFGVSSAIAIRWSGGSLALEPRTIEAWSRNDQQAGQRPRAWLGAASLCRNQDKAFLCTILQLGMLDMPVPEDVELAGDRSPTLATVGGRGGTDVCISRYLCLRGFLELHLTPGSPVLQLGSLTLGQTASFATIAGLGLVLPVDLE